MISSHLKRLERETNNQRYEQTHREIIRNARSKIDIRPHKKRADKDK